MASANEAAARLLLDDCLEFWSSWLEAPGLSMPVPVDVIRVSLFRLDFFLAVAAAAGFLWEGPGALGGKEVAPGGSSFFCKIRWAMLRRTFLLYIDLRQG